jgi:hypothetical protein
MNARDFLTEVGFPTTLAFTYSFDPVFFERVVLRALWIGGANDVLVLADGGEVDRAFERPHGPIRHLGREYALAPVREHGRFHPKLVLRLGADEGRVWIGSGNLTHGGWGLNREVGVAWRVGPDCEDSGSWIRPLMQRAREWTESPTSSAVLDRIADAAWLPTASDSTSRVLVSGGQTLAQQLTTRFAGRRFHRVRFMTGSTDETGEFLRWLARSFGVKQAAGAITPTRCSWTAARLKNLPMDLRLHPIDPPYLHAKAYHLSGPDGDVLLIGSANCGASAWLRPAAGGGNTEIMVVYDDPTAADLAFMDGLIKGRGLSAADALRGGTSNLEDDDVPPQYPIRIDALLIDEDGLIHARMVGVPSNAQVELVLHDERIHLEGDGSVWSGRTPDALPRGRTAFGYIEFRMGRKVVRSASRWLDDLRRLNEASGMKKFGWALANMHAAGSPKDDDRLINELSRLAHDLISDVQIFRDPFRAHKKREAEAAIVQPVDPTTLIRSLKDDVISSAHPPRGHEGTTGLGGIFRALFRDDAVEELEGTEIGDDEAAAARAQEDEEVPRIAVPRHPSHASTNPVSEKVRIRFEKHMNRFIDELASEDFRKRCTARQLLQATGYPFAATAFGLRREWTDVVTAREWLLRVARLLLHGDAGAPALLDAVRQRYTDQHAQDVFEKSVGEGTLWVAMTLGLVGAPWPDPADNLIRIIFVRDLWQAEELRASATSEHIEMLTRRYTAVEAVALMRDVAAPIGRAMDEIDAGLRTLCDREGFLTTRVPERPAIDAGELLWGPRNSWAVSLEPEVDGKIRVYFPKLGKEAKVLLNGWFVSVLQASERDRSIRQAVNELNGVSGLLLERDAQWPEVTSAAARIHG